jgi:hypothetical protein
LNKNVNFNKLLSLHYNSLYKNLTEPFNNSLPLSMDTFSKSILAINVFYKDTFHTEMMEIPEFTGDQLLASIGGNLGLFLGMSFLTLIEIVEILFNCLILIFKTYKKTTKVSEVE